MSMLWLIVAIISYFLLALVAIGDKFLLAGPPNPKIYTFYVGILSVLALLLVPFVNFFLPEAWVLLLGLGAGAVFIFALFAFYQGLQRFEASRIVPAIGGLVPLFTFSLVYFFARGNVSLSPWQILSFILLLFGSVLITFKTKKVFSAPSFKISAIAAFLFALGFVLAKQVYLSLPFWPGFIWMRLGSFLAALGFLATKEVREEIFGHKFTFKRKTGGIFLINQGLGAGAVILQNWAIALAGMAFLPIINALQGVQYAFLFIFATLLSLKFPKILSEKISKKILLQKMLAIVLIVAGLTLLAFTM